MDAYTQRKEVTQDDAIPVLAEEHFGHAEIEAANLLIARLESMQSGQAAAASYQRLVLEILNYLFEPHLADGEIEVRSFMGTERRDIIYSNEGSHEFWRYIRDTYRSLSLMIETKNVSTFKIDYVNQTAAYLGTRLGMLGLIICRTDPGENVILKTRSIHNDTPSVPRKVILILTDSDLTAMIRIRQEEGDPSKYVQTKYRQFFLSM